jgi:protein-L-isoaspartate(D-aspartate) O-methyltransferase
VEQEGEVHAYEIDRPLAELAARRLSDLLTVTVHTTNAVGVALPPTAVIYVNAAATAPDVGWLRALEPGGRLIFPWQATRGGAVTLLVRRVGEGFTADPTLPVGFIPCIGAQDAPEASGGRDPWDTRSVWLRADRPPDETATAVYEEVWFSTEPL